MPAANCSLSDMLPDEEYIDRKCEIRTDIKLSVLQQSA
jgi:hypothetical protein